MLTGFKIASSFALKARLSSLWLLAGCWIQLQNGCMYFPDKTGIFPDIKTSQEFTDFFGCACEKAFLSERRMFFWKSLSLFCLFLADDLVKMCSYLSRVICAALKE